ncbi:MAG: hypothetical protein EOO65_03830 [Methanosarcinales archaeon]|nr:MAG: hypothetical protein EOO65_03830 [Methanosarcinales archaeon]
MCPLPSASSQATGKLAPLSTGMPPAPAPALALSSPLAMVVSTASTPCVQLDVVWPIVNTFGQPDSMFNSVDLPSLHVHTRPARRLMNTVA